jgi:hypothetical protein
MLFSLIGGSVISIGDLYLNNQNKIVILLRLFIRNPSKLKKAMITAIQTVAW